jgi:hypothetical protein
MNKLFSARTLENDCTLVCLRSACTLKYYEHGRTLRNGSKTGSIVLGISDGRLLGISDGRALGMSEGRALGMSDGRALGTSEGIMLGISDAKMAKKSLGPVDSHTLRKRR